MDFYFNSERFLKITRIPRAKRHTLLLCVKVDQMCYQQCPNGAVQYISYLYSLNWYTVKIFHRYQQAVTSYNHR